MKLYYIDADDGDGYNCSLFVYADTPEAAFDIWKDSEVGGLVSSVYFEDVLSSRPADQADENDLRIFEVPLGPTQAGALPWNDPAGVHCVAFAEEV